VSWRGLGEVRSRRIVVGDDPRAVDVCRCVLGEAGGGDFSSTVRIISTLVMRMAI